MRALVGVWSGRRAAAVSCLSCAELKRTSKPNRRGRVRLSVYTGLHASSIRATVWSVERNCTRNERGGGGGGLPVYALEKDKIPTLFDGKNHVKKVFKCHIRFIFEWFYLDLSFVAKNIVIDLKVIIFVLFIRFMFLLPSVLLHTCEWDLLFKTSTM